MRNSLILEFEICYGQVRPLLERALVDISEESPADVAAMTFRSLIQLANERAFTRYRIEEWLAFRAMRNRIAHAYSEPMAESIAVAVPQFVAFAHDFAARVHAQQKELQ